MKNHGPMILHIAILLDFSTIVIAYITISIVYRSIYLVYRSYLYGMIKIIVIAVH